MNLIRLTPYAKRVLALGAAWVLLVTALYFGGQTWLNANTAAWEAARSGE